VELPDAVRARLVTLVAASLGDVTPLPPALRQVAGFAPARRARLGASAIVTELERDDELRARVATQVATRANGDATDVAALAWLERGEGWEDAVLRGAERPRTEDAVRQDREQRLRERAEEAERALREQRRAHREALDAVKAELVTVRRTLGETRAREKAAREEAEAARSAAEDEAARLDREVRALRSQVARLEEQAGEQRRRTRSERDEVNVRARLLLDTLGDAVAGLRRELALPPVSGTPGERVEEAYAGEAPEPAGAGPTVQDAARLTSYLSMPRSRLLVDGYNVSKTVWPTLSLEAQRSRLLTLLGALVARTGAETTVVFDGGDAKAPTAPAPRGVRVVFSPAGVIADDVLRELVAAEPAGRVVVVVTDDQALGADLRRAGATVARVQALAG
jgi:hypothetical protein